MKFLQGFQGTKLISFFLFLSIFLVAASSVQIYELSRSGRSSPDSAREVNLKATGSANPNPKPIDESTNAQDGSCTVTKNGETQKIATSSVSIKEKSNTGVNLNVGCESGNNNSNNQSTVNTNVDVEVNTSN